MKNYIILFLVLLFSSCFQETKSLSEVSANLVNPAFDQDLILKTKKIPKKGSSIYWINTAYLNCLHSEHSVCDCLLENQFVLLFIDSLNKGMTINSSIHHGMENLTEYEILPDTIASSYFMFKNIGMPSDAGRFIILNNVLTLHYKNKTIAFERITLNTLDFPSTPKAKYSRGADMSSQLASLNSISLLNYPITFKSDSSYLFKSFEELESLIKENKVFIYCSDDFYYNSVRIKDSINEYYHLEYAKDYISLYHLGKEGRNRGEKINTYNMKRQVFFRLK